MSATSRAKFLTNIQIYTRQITVLSIAVIVTLRLVTEIGSCLKNALEILLWMIAILFHSTRVIKKDIIGRTSNSNTLIIKRCPYSRVFKTIYAEGYERVEADCG